MSRLCLVAFLFLPLLLPGCVASSAVVELCEKGDHRLTFEPAPADTRLGSDGSLAIRVNLTHQQGRTAAAALSRWVYYSPSALARLIDAAAAAPFRHDSAGRTVVPLIYSADAFHNIFERHGEEYLPDTYDPRRVTDEDLPLLVEAPRTGPVLRPAATRQGETPAFLYRREGREFVLVLQPGPATVAWTELWVGPVGTVLLPPAMAFDFVTFPVQFVLYANRI